MWCLTIARQAQKEKCVLVKKEHSLFCQPWFKMVINKAADEAYSFTIIFSF